MRKRLTHYEVYDITNKFNRKFRGVYPARSTLQAFKKYLIKTFVNRSDFKQIVKRVSAKKGRSLKKSLLIRYHVKTGFYAGDMRGNEFTFEIFSDENKILFAKYDW